MPKRLIRFGALLLVYLAICFAVHLVLYKSTLELSSYRTMIASVSGRIHEPMSQYEIQHLSSQVSEIEFGGDLRGLGLNYEAKPLASYLRPTSFDMRASLKLLDDGRLRAAQVKFDSLSSKIDAVYARRIYLLSTLSKVAGGVALILLFIFAWLWRRSTGHWSQEISVAQEAIGDDTWSFERYLQAVVGEEVKFIGHRASLACNGFDIPHIDSSLRAALEQIAEQLVRNSIEHGGRPAEDRLLVGKADHLSIRVTLEEQQSSWLLSVWDDGEGLDADEILKRALELKLLNQASANTLVPEQRVKLVFMRGFTTREQLVSTAENDAPLSELRVIAKRFQGVMSVQNQHGDYCQFMARFPKL